jgi:formylglycine-generating enzyme required for sulfatase activity
MKAHVVVFRLSILLVSMIWLAGCTQHTLTITIEGSGTTDPSTGAHQYAQGTSVAVTATAASGWAFNHWEGMLSGNGNPSTVILNSDISVTAVFVQSQGGEGESGNEGEGEGPPVSVNLVTVPATTFTMGALDAEDGQGDELPRHTVQLTSYQIMKYDVTNGQYAAMLNWAQSKGYLKTDGGQAYDGGDVYSANQFVASTGSSDGRIEYNSTTNIFFVPPRDTFDVSSHPVENVSWYGAALFCNWLSQINGLTPCYNTLSWACTAGTGGYHLPTEAQWERAAAWDNAASRHWIYGFASDTIDPTRANYERYEDSVFMNPLGLSNYPYTTPVGWFNGVNVNPNGSVQTVDSPSPVGCYDMSGTVWQWCNDWYTDTYYNDCLSLGTVNNPPGPAAPASGPQRVLRGGSWWDYDSYCRTARRAAASSDRAADHMGFRVVRY